MQTILGAGGVIGRELALALREYTDEIRLVSRNPRKINKTDELIAADLTKAEEIEKTVKGSAVVYVTIGFTYSAEAWKKYWPDFMTNVITACKNEGCKLVFFDNVYMYDQNHLHYMTEDTPINPVSEKGKVRTKIARMVMDAVNRGELTALIARSADFYGPGIKKNSMLTESVFNLLNRGKQANWIGSVKYKHSFTFTPDAGKATAILGNTEEAYNQVWHLPTASNPPTGKEWIEIIAGALGVKAKYAVAPKFMVKILGLFIPIMKEIYEMAYQYDRDYVFNSDKFEKKFTFSPTPYEEGVKKIANIDYNN
jgi:nucleoside-diphosphate-sugar epimerase